jgi:eukaryotic-like serine/threonine-protein kinase
MMDAASAADRGRLPQVTKYELFEELGHGGMATVYRARDKRLGREVAIKVIHPHLRDTREVVARFNAEARAVAKLHHANIVEVFDVSDPDEPEQYLVVELLRGTTLRKLLQDRRVMPPEVAAAVALELLGALAHAHANGVVHRDIKPENVLIAHTPSTGGADGSEGVVVKLTDFGIAKLLDAQGVTSTGQVLGSPAHMSPEQIEGGDVDVRADVFGLGVLLYECMVGHLPFEGSNPAQVLRRVLDGQYPEAQRERPLVGAQWSVLLDRALAHSPAERFADAHAMRDSIAAELNRLGISSPERELADWLVSPAAYEAPHAKRMIEKLCALGNEARKRGHVLGAAADYNRALAHAPDDPQLLRLVAAMNRAEARARFLKRAVVALMLMLGMGSVAFAIGRHLRAQGTAKSPPASVGATALVSSPRPPIAPGPPSATPSSEASARAPSVATSSPTAPRISPPRTERNVTLRLQPPMGVTLSIDGESNRIVSTGEALRLDSGSHSLSFGCDVCLAVQQSLPAGERDETLTVTVPIKPAILNVQGDLDKTYQIVEDPQLVIRPGSNTVALKSMFRSVTIRQMETDMRVRVRLEAGKTVPAVF